MKVQWQGRRRTLALHASGRKEAASEAAALFRRIVEVGWDAALRLESAPGIVTDPILPVGTDSAIGESAGLFADRVNAFPQNSPDSASDSHHSEFRLLARPYPGRRDGARQTASMNGGWAVRLEEDGHAHYLMLGATERSDGLRRAHRLQEQLGRLGLNWVLDHYPREKSVAIRWVSNPMCWTYFAVHTRPLQADFNPDGKVFSEPAGIPAAPDAAKPNSFPADVPRLRVLVVEPDRGLRVAWEESINQQDGCECVATVSDPAEISGEFAAQDIGLVLQNDGTVGSPRPPWIQNVPRLWFSVYEDSDQLFRSTPGGAYGYVLQRCFPDECLKPLVGWHRGGRLTSERVDALVRHHFQSMVVSGSYRDEGAMGRLTPREMEVLGLLSRGFVDKEIAAALGISGWTVHGHVKSIFDKLGVRTRTEAVVHYLRR